jgi:hypothetical protein
MNFLASITRRPSRKTAARCLTRLFSGALVAGMLFAQSAPPAEPASREEAIASEKARKAADSRPPERDRAEEIVLRAEKLFLVDPSGFFPYFDSVYQGGGLTLGAGYRRFYGDNTFWEVKGLYSVLNYKLIEAATVSKDRMKGRLRLESRLGWRDATQVAYYGLGMQSKPEDRANFRFQETYADGGATYRPVRWLPFKGTVAYEHWATRQGKGADPSIETRYTAWTRATSTPKFRRESTGGHRPDIHGAAGSMKSRSTTITTPEADCTASRSWTPRRFNTSPCFARHGSSRGEPGWRPC